MKYQKKPVVVEAYRMTRERRWDNKDWPEWLNAAWQMSNGAEGGFWCLKSDLDCIFIGTLEGAVRVSFGDWIIRGVKGELYPCKPDIFGETYGEAVHTGAENENVRLQRATAILNERDRQDDLWGKQDHSLPEWMVILAEEVGELSTAIADVIFHAGKPKKNWRTEAVQVAAVALAMLEQCQDAKDKP